MIKVKIYDGHKHIRTIMGDMFVGVVGTERDDGYGSHVGMCGRSTNKGAIGMMGALANAVKYAAADMAEASGQVSGDILLLAHLEALNGGKVEEKEDE